MADLDIKQLGVTLESTSGTIAFTDGVLDRTQNKSQDTINAELYAGAGAGIYTIAPGDRVLDVANQVLGSTIGLTYEKRDGDTAKKIYLTGIKNEAIASIDTTDFTKDKMVKSAELVEVAEPGVTIEVPYIKIIFNDDTEDPVRFSVKSLVDIYTGANLKLSPDYTSTAGVAPSSNVTLDAAMKNVDTRVAALEGNNYVNSFAGKTGDIAFGDYGGGNGEVQFSIDNNGKITGWANTSIYAYKTGVLERVVGTTSLDGFIRIAASDRTNGQQTLTPLVTVAKKSTYIDGASPTGDMLASAYAVKEYTGTYVTTHAYPKDSGEDIAARIGFAETDIETLNTAVADNSGRIGVLETYGTNATVIGTTTYDEWSVIVGG